MTRPLLAVAAVALISVVGLPPAIARDDRTGGNARAKVQAKLVGSWKLRSFVSLGAGAVGYPLGKDAVGKLTYTRDGHVWALVARRGVPKNLPDANWYTGTYDIDLERRTIVHHVEFGSVAAWEGGDQPRLYRLRKNHLTLSIPATAPGGATSVLRWTKRSSSGVAGSTRLAR
jgi:hypothetical protein